MITIETKYALKNNDANTYLDKDDCETEDITEAMLFDFYSDALDYKDDIDVAYIYEIVGIEVGYKVLK